MTSGRQLRGGTRSSGDTYGLELVSKPAIFRQKKLGGGGLHCIERLPDMNEPTRVLRIDVCYDRGVPGCTFRLKWFLDDGAP